MSSDVTAPVLVPNRYRLAVQTAKRYAEFNEDALHGMFDAVLKAFESGAWESSLADERYRQMCALRGLARTAADRTSGEFDQAIGRQPLEVSSDSWQARWSDHGGGSVSWGL